MTPTPPEGFKIIPRAYLEAGNPLPDDTVFWGERSKTWLVSPVRGERTCNFYDIHATAQPLPCFQKGGDEPCATNIEANAPVIQSSQDTAIQDARNTVVASNAPVAVQSPDQGPEHNPDNLSPEQYGAPEWRLLRVGEITEDGDQCDVSPDGTDWRVQLEGLEIIPEFCCTYRRRVAPEPEQTLEQRIAELERENDQLALIGSEAVQLLRDWLIGSECFCTPEGCASRQPCSFCKTTAFIAAGDSNNDDPYELTVESYRADRDRLAEENAQLERERDEARAEAVLQRECNEKHSELHRKVSQKALIDRDSIRAQLAASEKDRERLDWLERIDHQKQLFGNWIGGGGTLRAAIDAKSLSPRTTENTKPQ